MNASSTSNTFTHSERWLMVRQVGCYRIHVTLDEVCLDDVLRILVNDPHSIVEAHVPWRPDQKASDDLYARVIIPLEFLDRHSDLRYLARFRYVLRNQAMLPADSRIAARVHVEALYHSEEAVRALIEGGFVGKPSSPCSHSHPRTDPASLWQELSNGT